MARSFASASNQYLSLAATVPTSEALTFAAWAYPLQSDQGCVIVSLGNGGSANGGYILACGSAGVSVANKTDNFGAGGSASSAASYSANTWSHFCGVFSADASRSAFLNGANKGTNATDVGDPSNTNVAIGGRLNSALSFPMNGYVAHVAIWTVALTDAEVASLYNNGIGADPRSIRPGSLWGYWPLLNADGDQDYWANYHLTATASPTYAKHPPVLMRSRPRQVMPASTSSGPPTISSVTLTGTSQIGQTLTATVVTDPASGPTIAYQWEAAEDDEGASAFDLGTASTQALTYSDLGAYLDSPGEVWVRCGAVATDGNGSSDETFSAWQQVTIPSSGGSGGSLFESSLIR